MVQATVGFVADYRLPGVLHVALTHRHRGVGISLGKPNQTALAGQSRRLPGVPAAGQLIWESPSKNIR